MKSYSNEIIFEKKGHKAYIILNRPEKLNALTMDMYEAITQILEDVEKDDDIRVVILKGNGRAFSAGFDLGQEGNVPVAEEKRECMAANINRWKIWNSSKIFIAQLHGYCIEGALELALPCDFVVAAESTKIGEPAITFGGGGCFMMVPWLVNHRDAKQLLLTGEYINGREAKEMGLISRCYPDDELETGVEELATKLAKMPTVALSTMKLGINRTYDVMGMRTAIDNWVDLLMFMTALKTPDVIEFNRIVDEQGVKAALKWRDEQFEATQE